MFWFSAVRQTASALIEYLATSSMFSYEKKRCPVYVVFGCVFVPGAVPSILFQFCDTVADGHVAGLLWNTKPFEG